MPFLMAHTRPNIPFLFPDFESKMDVMSWNAIMLDIDHTENACHLREVQYFKCREDKQHEFLVIEIEHDKTKLVARVLVDRAPENPSGNEPSSKRPSQMVSSLIPAHDMIRIQGSRSSSLTRDFIPCDRLATLSFGQRPTLLHLTAVLGVVHQHAPYYDLYNHQCYWFADTIWGILSSTCYQPILKPETKWTKRGKYSLAPVGKDSLGEIEQEYQDALAKAVSEVQSRLDKVDVRDKQVCHAPYR
jgi:hypothetical protein